MSLAASLFDYLRSYAPLTALIGSRLYAVRSPERTASDIQPLVVMRLANEEQESDLGGAAVNLRVADYEFHCMATGYTLAHDMAEAVRTALTGYRGAMGDVTVQATAFSGARDDEQADLGLFIVPVEYRLWYKP